MNLLSNLLASGLRKATMGSTEPCGMPIVSIIIKNNIVAIADASIGIAKFYEFCVLKMKTGQMMRGLGMSEPTDEELKRLEDEFMEEIEDLNNEDKPKRTIH